MLCQSTAAFGFIKVAQWPNHTTSQPELATSSNGSEVTPCDAPTFALWSSYPVSHASISPSRQTNLPLVIAVQELNHDGGISQAGLLDGLVSRVQ